METIYKERFEQKKDELHDLYMQLYGNDAMFAELCEHLYAFYKERSEKLKTLDKKREADPNWYKKNDMLGMMFYIDNFAGNMKGVQGKLDYLEKNNVNYIHLMPFLDTPKGRSDGGYAVADFRKVQENLGSMEDLENLTNACHEKGISVCMDFVMNHTSEDHEWAKKARQGDGEYMSRYFFFDNAVIPSEYEKTVPQVFPTTAPGNFTWLPEIGHYVMTTFYPYQWDLNYKNPRVFNEMIIYTIARAENLEVTDKEYNDYIDNMLESSGIDEKTFEDTYGVTIDDYCEREGLRPALLYNKVMEKVFEYGKAK